MRNRLMLVLSLAILLFVIAGSPVIARSQNVAVESTDKNHKDADSVSIEQKSRTATIIITHNRGIGSAQVKIRSNWKGRLRMVFRNFSSLEKFAVTDGTTSMEGVIRHSKKSGESWEMHKGATVSNEARADNPLAMRAVGDDVQLEIPEKMFKSNRPIMLNLSWIDAYRN